MKGSELITLTRNRGDYGPVFLNPFQIESITIIPREKGARVKTTTGDQHYVIEEPEKVKELADDVTSRFEPMEIRL